MLLSEGQKEYLVKPKIIIIASVIEAVLDDFLVRVDQAVYDKVQLDQEIIDILKKTDTPRKFPKINSRYQNYGILGDDPVIYENIQILIEMRNRIHIANKYSMKPADEVNLFRGSTLNFAEMTIEIVLEFMSANYLRVRHMHGCEKFILPWRSKIHISRSLF